LEPKRNSASGHLYFGRDGLIGIINTSVLAFLASSATILIPVRALAGIMAALVNPLALAIITVTFDAQERPKALGFLGIAGGLGTIVNPFFQQ